MAWAGNIHVEAWMAMYVRLRDPQFLSGTHIRGCQMLYLKRMLRTIGSVKLFFFVSIKHTRVFEVLALYYRLCFEMKTKRLFLMKSEVVNVKTLI